MGLASLALFIAFFIAVIGLFKKDKVERSKLVTVMAVYGFVGSLISCIFYFVISAAENVRFGVLLAYVGGLIGLVGVYNLSSIFFCKKMIMATYVGFNSYTGGKGQQSHAPVFKYTYEGRSYEEQSAQTESYKLLAKQMMPGSQYNIYIDENMPSRFIMKRKIRISGIVMLLMGVFFVGMGIYIINANGIITI